MSIKAKNRRKRKARYSKEMTLADLHKQLVHSITVCQICRDNVGQSYDEKTKAKMLRPVSETTTFKIVGFVDFSEATESAEPSLSADIFINRVKVDEVHII